MLICKSIKNSNVFAVFIFLFNRLILIHLYVFCPKAKNNVLSFNPMDVREENTFEVNNYPVTDWDKVDNVGTSDELSPNNQDSEYAKSKREGKTVTTLSLFAISGVALLTGTSLFSSLYSEPTLSNVSISSSKNTISLSLSIKNKQGLKVLSSLFEDSSLKEEIEMTYKGEKDFSYTYENVDFSKENVLKISFTNNIDYSKILYEKPIYFEN